MGLIQCPRCKNSVDKNNKFCPKCNTSVVKECWVCEGSGRETSTITHYDGIQEEKSRQCLQCDGGGSYISRVEVNLKTGKITGYINDREADTYPPLGWGW